VKALAEELEISLCRGSQGSDAAIARSALAALNGCDAAIACERMKITVQDGWVTLDGEADSESVKIAAQNAVDHALGVRGVVNQLVVVPRASASEVKANIEGALAQRALSDAERIEVEALEDTVILRGSVHSWQAKVDAERAAWSTRGVGRVEDDLVIMPTLRFADVEQG
jgi:osmotically-inducible protein OsmY